MTQCSTGNAGFRVGFTGLFVSGHAIVGVMYGSSPPCMGPYSTDTGQSKAQFRRRTFHEPNLIQIKTGPNHEYPAELN